MSFAPMTIEPLLFLDTQDGGTNATPIGHTYLKGDPSNTPVKARVVLFEQRTCRPLREVWSDPVTGAYQFKNISSGTFSVLAFDPSGAYGGEAETDIVLPTVLVP